MPNDTGNTDSERDPDDIFLGNGDTLSERIDRIAFDELDETDVCTAAELRERLER